MVGKLGKCAIALGCLCLLGALTITLFNVHEERRAEQTALAQTAVLQEMIPSRLPKEQPIVPEEQVVMPTVSFDAQSYVGMLQIPGLDRPLPVRDQWSEALLKQSPCLYEGNLSDGMIIAGHNYRAHFKPLLSVLPGAEILFTDADGNVWHYEVKATEVISGYDIDSMVAGDWDLTLFTCTYGGTDRFTVRCKRV